MIPQISELLVRLARAACDEWRYPLPSESWLEDIDARLPEGLQTAVSDAVESGVIIVDGYRFRLKGLAKDKGPYAFLSRATNRIPSVNWEYFVQAAEFGRVAASVESRGYRVGFEEEWMDISVWEGDNLVWCIEAKEKATALERLRAGISRYGVDMDWETPDRGNDPLRKSKYLMVKQPRYFSLVAIGLRFDFSVDYSEDGFVLTEDLIPIA